ncbi:MAG TPA: hypothetical protein VMC48_01040, partial [Methanobacterium sp.]|nr:hypothetical protein [Methanobacterium sp.]
MSAMSFLLILPAIMLFMVFIDMNTGGIQENSQKIESNCVINGVKDLEAEIQVTGKETFKNEAENVVKSGIPLSNSRQTIKNEMQIRMNKIAKRTTDNNDIEVECNITSV